MGKIEDSLKEIAKDIILRKRSIWEDTMNSIYPGAKLHFSVDFAYKDIKHTLDVLGYYSEYINTKTDTGLDKKREPDGGIMYVTIPLKDTKIFIPIAWVEIKESNSCTTGKGTRGQAVGLITEQAETCRLWVNALGGRIKPLIAFVEGSDFDSEIGTYNIDRIMNDLHTKGNVNPYAESNDNLCVSWLFYNKKFSSEDFIKKMELAMDKNIIAVKGVLQELILRYGNDCESLEEKMSEPAKSFSFSE